MASEKYNIEIELKGKLEEASKTIDALNQIESATGNLSRSLSSTSTVINGFLMELGAMGTRLATQLPSAITSTIQAFGRQEAAVQKLASAIRSQGGSVSEVLPIMQNFAAEMQRITSYGDEQVLAMQSMATSMGVSEAQMQSVIRSAIGLSSALGMDVMTATKAASAAVQGKTGALQEYIPSLSKCKTEEEKLAQVQKLSASGFAQAKAEAETTAGKLKQAANAWGDLAEVAGGTFAPAAVGVANALKSICEQLSKNSEITGIFIGGLSSLAVGFAFSKIGGLASVTALFKMVAGGMSAAKVASDGLNASLRANPLGIAITAVSAFGMAVSHLAAKEKERYKQNIEQSREYREGIDAEIESMKQWGISADDNKRRTAEVAAEIAKLKAEETKYRNDSGTVNAAYGGAMYKTYSSEEQAQLDNYRAKIEKLEERQKAAANAKDLDALAAKNHADAMRQSAEILAKSGRETAAAKDAATALAQTRERLAAVTKEVADLENALAGAGVADSERVAKANRLAQARREVLQLGKQELEQAMQLAASDYAAKKSAELGRQYEIEMKLARATAAGDAAARNAAQSALEEVQASRGRLDLETAFVEAKRAEIKTEEDLARVRADAAKYAGEMSKAQRAEGDAQKWLAGEIEASKVRQQGLELDILRARASGNETLAKELEGSQRVAQLASEIFENARREGMSRDELVELQNSANAQARERYNLEKSITDEAERQNLAKDAQAKIEDILTENKIEQLKAQGKMAEAQALERESQIQRKLDGMQGVSDEDKEKLRATMRQTYAYKDAQRGQAAGGLNSVQNFRRSPAGNGADVSSALARKNSMMAGGGFGGGFGSAGGSSRRSGRPATVSAKYADLYDEWKSAGGSKSGQSWTAFRDANKGDAEDRKAGRQSAAAKRLSGQAQGYLGGASEAARKMAGAVPKGISKTADEAQNASPSRANRQKQTPQPQTADAALGRELQKRGTDGDKGGDLKKDTDNIEKMAKALDDCLQSLKDIKNNTAATATKKESK